ncbi:fungal-specific transcription factor domain-containing protein [Exophiala viscosa]|uniref:Fungal-specific transcription factor domain-containing protein n=1 Tax=Exophiala viscosa TaxID=2486360 RepID=A0AAN6DY44_9EURO|nr:fungal-specific transcription factor domain-containing protein [Exophiala viscosa]KAI1624334.1 fungal-specific transcription factor domain-containing protein [Exophiala viscosa]
MGRVSGRPKFRPPRKRNRTFTGCWRCRSRKVKCGGEKPACRACLRLGGVCSGYDAKVIWVDEDTQTFKSDGRRHVQCQLTWAGVPVLNSDLVDFLIEKCDQEASDSISGSLSTSSIASTHNPFSALRFDRTTPQDVSPVPLTLPLVPSLNSYSLAPEENHLFQHYVNHVAVIMMPFEHSRNPWTSSYPAAALHYSSTEQRALYDAILSHSGFHLAQLSNDRDRWAILATKHYNKAIQMLMKSISQERMQYGPTVAAIMTLLMAETYSGRSEVWKHHLKGAWSLLLEHRATEPWLDSDFACISTQSLNIIRIVAQTARLDAGGLGQDAIRCPGSGCGSTKDSTLVSSIASTLDFGFTIGATKDIMECISRITATARDIQVNGHLPSMDDEISSILEQLKTCEGNLKSLSLYPGNDAILLTPNGLESISTPRDVPYHQLRAFILATYVYFYRVIFDLPPCSLTAYVSSTFEHVANFSGKHAGNFSLWPAFIAATEAYTDNDMRLARDWLQHALSFGMGSRAHVQTVLEELWHRRERIAQNLGVDKGSVSVDWRQVMRDLQVDVLLV